MGDVFTCTSDGHVLFVVTLTPWEKFACVPHCPSQCLAAPPAWEFKEETPRGQEQCHVEHEPEMNLSKKRLPRGTMAISSHLTLVFLLHPLL